MLMALSHSSDGAHGYICPTPVMILMVMSHSSDDSHGYFPLQWCPTPVMILMVLSHSTGDAYGSVPLQQKGDSSHWGGYKNKQTNKQKLKNKSVKLSSRDCLSVLCIDIFHLSRECILSYSYTLAKLGWKDRGGGSFGMWQGFWLYGIRGLE